MSVASGGEPPIITMQPAYSHLQFMQVLSYITIWATQHPIQGAFILKNQGDWGTALFTLSLSANVIATCKYFKSVCMHVALN